MDNAADTQRYFNVETTFLLLWRRFNPDEPVVKKSVIL
jgi:hypothetical protein